MKSFIDIVSEDTDVSHLLTPERVVVNENTADIMMASKSFEENSVAIQAMLIAMEGSVSLCDKYVVRENTSDNDDSTDKKKDEPGFFTQVWEKIKTVCKSIYVAFLKVFARISEFFVEAAVKIWAFFSEKLLNATNESTSMTDDFDLDVPAQENAIGSSEWSKAANAIDIVCSKAQLLIGSTSSITNYSDVGVDKKRFNKIISDVLNVPDDEIIEKKDIINSLSFKDAINDNYSAKVTVKIAKLFPTYQIALDHIKNARRDIESLDFLKKDIDRVFTVLERKFNSQTGDPKAARLRVLCFNKMTSCFELIAKNAGSDIIAVSRLGVACIKKVRSYNA